MLETKFDLEANHWLELLHGPNQLDNDVLWLANTFFVASLYDTTDRGLRDYKKGNCAVTVSFGAAAPEDTPQHHEPHSRLERLFLKYPSAYTTTLHLPKKFWMEDHLSGFGRLMTFFHREYKCLPNVSAKKGALTLTLLNTSLKRTITFTFTDDSQ